MMLAIALTASGIGHRGTDMDFIHVHASGHVLNNVGLCKDADRPRSESGQPSSEVRR